MMLFLSGGYGSNFNMQNQIIQKKQNNSFYQTICSILNQSSYFNDKYEDCWQNKQKLSIISYAIKQGLNILSNLIDNIILFDCQFKINRKTYDQKMTYSKISYQKRLKLIKLVLEKKKSIKRASEILQIKLSTAKQIVRKYKYKGKITKKRCQNLIDQQNDNRLNDNNVEQAHIQENNKYQENQVNQDNFFNFQGFWRQRMKQYYLQIQMNWFFNYYQAFNIVTSI